MTPEEAKAIYRAGERRIQERRTNKKPPPILNYMDERRRPYDRRGALDPAVETIRAAWAAEVRDVKGRLGRAHNEQLARWTGEIALLRADLARVTRERDEAQQALRDARNGCICGMDESLP